MKTYESSGKTVEEAISQGLAHLKATINDVTIDIIDEGSKGLFGLFGSRQAMVKLTLKHPSPEESSADIINMAHKKATKEFKIPLPSTNGDSKSLKKAEKAQEEDLKEKAPYIKEEEPVPLLSDEEKQELLKKALAFLEHLTSLMDISTTVTGKIGVANSLEIEFNGESMGLLIGRRGETLDALQYLTNLHINKDTEVYVRVVLDTENYREKREQSLIRLANRMANRALKSGRRVSLEPMNPYERRIIHNTLQSNKRVNTHSEGDDPYRRLVITVRRK